MRCRAIKPLLAVCAVLLTSSCQPRLSTWHTEFLAFGTTIELSVWGVPDAAAYAAGEEIRHMFETLHHRWHPWDTGALGVFNSGLMNEGTATGDEELKQTIRRALGYSQLSGGLFQPGVAALVRKWGFNEAKPGTMPPDPEELHRLLRSIPRYEEIAWQNGRLISPRPGWAVDLGGLAKGVAVDRAIKLLRQAGIDNAIINAGGDLRAIGSPGRRSWRIGIRNPRGPGVIAGILIQDDESVFTSGDYERYFEFQGRRYHHILDPRTGYPAAETMSVTVIGKDGATADAAATALFVAGPGEWSAVADSMGIHEVMLIASDGHIEMTAEMAARIQLQVADGTAISIVGQH